MRLLLVDAYDSFTHNLAQSFAEIGVSIQVVRCDQVHAREILERSPDLCVFGPGPGRPEEAGCFVEAIRALAGVVPVLGVCLGHQAIAVAFGGRLKVHPPVHGHATAVHHDGTGIFEGVPLGAPMGRYHSLGIEPEGLPSVLRVTARSDDGVIMGVEHRSQPLYGVQFHPESVLSGDPGLRVLRNFVARGLTSGALALRTASRGSP